MIEKRIGKIKSVRFGFGGYQDAMFGASFDLGSTKDCWGVGDFKGAWARDPDKHCKWTKADRDKVFAETCLFLRDIMQDAGVDSVDKLKGVPVEVEFDGKTLKSWRVLKEVI